MPSFTFIARSEHQGRPMLHAISEPGDTMDDALRNFRASLNGDWNLIAVCEGTAASFAQAIHLLEFNAACSRWNLQEQDIGDGAENPFIKAEFEAAGARPMISPGDTQTSRPPYLGKVTFEGRAEITTYTSEILAALECADEWQDVEFAEYIMRSARLKLATVITGSGQGPIVDDKIAAWKYRVDLATYHYQRMHEMLPTPKTKPEPPAIPAQIS